MIRLVYPDIGTLYTIPQSGWAAVNLRVRLAIQAQPVAAEMAQMMPSYPALLTASQNWSGSVFPTLLRQAGQVVSFARQTVGQLGALKQSMAAIGSTDPLPRALAVQGQAVLTSLRTGATAMAAAFGPLVPALQQFAEVNVNVDLELRKFQGVLGYNWPPLGEQLSLTENALGRTVGGWAALVSDLKDAGTPGVSLDLPELLELDIGGAIASWTEIENDAAQFVGFANNPQGGT